MSINSPSDGLEIDNSPRYEDFEDILEYDNAASTTALVPEENVCIKEDISEDTLIRDIEKVEKLRAKEVRWFYQSGKKKRWKAFIGSDSLHIETEWRGVSKSTSDINRVCVRGGMYEVDVLERKCYPVYWSSFNLKGVEESVSILRGTWFYEANFMPLSEDVADRLEIEHVERWKDCSLKEVKTLIGNTVMHSLKSQHCHYDWYSVNDVYEHSDAVSRRALRNIVQRFGASKTSTSGHKLHRGYREDAVYEDRMPPVHHLIFVVHGIGSKPDRHKIVRNTNELRLACERTAAKHFSHYTGRVEFLPVEWRTKLVLDNGIVETLMPRKSVGVRQFLNNNAMDIMYYTSPLFRAEIVSGLRQEITRLYKMFMERNPSFVQDGKISVFAHSLGTVIMHDIMTGWSPEALFEGYLQKKQDSSLTGFESPDHVSSGLDHNLAQIRLAKAKLVKLEAEALSLHSPESGIGFVIENFFCVGSPLGIFLALRGQRPSDGKGTQEDIVPKDVCHRIFNIFHPADPIAYRFEPLVLAHYIGIAPLQVHSNNAVLKTPYCEMPTKSYNLDTPREMVNMSNRQPSVDSDVNPMDISDFEDNFEKKDFSNLDENEGNSSSKNPDDGSVSSPTLARRSYLRAISGSAFRAGKALFSRARGAPSCLDECSQLDTSPDKLSNEDIPAGTSDLSETKRNSVSLNELSPGSSPSKIQKEMQQTNVVGDSISIDSPYLEHRLDYELQEGFTESRLGYASLTSHTSYWGNQDVALFVLMQIHPASAMTQSIRS